MLPKSGSARTHRGMSESWTFRPSDSLPEGMLPRHPRQWGQNGETEARDHWPGEGQAWVRRRPRKAGVEPTVIRAWISEYEKKMTYLSPKVPSGPHAYFTEDTEVAHSSSPLARK